MQEEQEMNQKTKTLEVLIGNKAKSNLKSFNKKINEEKKQQNHTSIGKQNSIVKSGDTKQYSNIEEVLLIHKENEVIKKYLLENLKNKKMLKRKKLVNLSSDVRRSTIFGLIIYFIFIIKKLNYLLI